MYIEGELKLGYNRSALHFHAIFYIVKEHRPPAGYHAKHAHTLYYSGDGIDSNQNELKADAGELHVGEGESCEGVLR
uniref:Uncharacterized protein n=1 Tax=Triticum urartu TaxID=4572 RepID=A0A8R7PEW9_TRIUA